MLLGKMLKSSAKISIWKPRTRPKLSTPGAPRRTIWGKTGEVILANEGAVSDPTLKNGARFSLLAISSFSLLLLPDGIARAIFWAILILRALTFAVSSVDQRKASSAVFHHWKVSSAEFHVSSVDHRKPSSAEFDHRKPSSAQFEHRKPSSAQFDHRKPSSAEFEHRKPSSAQFDHRKPSSAQFDHRKPSSPEFDHRKPTSAEFVHRKASSTEFNHWKAGLEINERPHKKAFLGLGNLSISDCGTGKGVTFTFSFYCF
ncbi:hypothetical protein ZIOFF_075462 [Zingiber officinale]|uniref:Uncharacterized protein n=1 Tax=Zingiber officinale TaxID=94328 RepID=A0A8J5EKV9_ZINOF|nr:hypothetical protein ZIOFF_075462 [Zingiber officinale]